jgi:retinol dehydrogenase-12
MQGKVCIVTGANSGIGLVSARELAKLGARVVLGCRNEARGLEARDAIRRETGNQDVELILVDVGSIASLRAFSEQFHARYDRLDVLMNNAGLSLPTLQHSADGLEMMFAINHVGYHGMACLHADLLRKTPGARVVNVSSEGHRGGTIQFDNLQCERSFNAVRQYCNTKLANVLFTRELARRFENDGITANCLHPGVIRSGFAQDEPGWFGTLVKLTSPFMLSTESGAKTQLYLATSPEVADITGEYFLRRKVCRTTSAGRDMNVAAKLWNYTVERTGIDLPA